MEKEADVNFSCSESLSAGQTAEIATMTTVRQVVQQQQYAESAKSCRH